jgi:hypothetical protein
MRVAPIVLGLVISTSSYACGGSSPASPPSARVGGNWAGTVQYRTVFGPFDSPFTMNLTQSGSIVRGTFAWGNAVGSVQGTTTSSTFTGTFVFDASFCSGIFEATGPAGGNTLKWTSQAVRASCTDMPFAIIIDVAAR